MNKIIIIHDNEYKRLPESFKLVTYQDYLQNKLKKAGIDINRPYSVLRNDTELTTTYKQLIQEEIWTMQEIVDREA